MRRSWCSTRPTTPPCGSAATFPGARSPTTRRRKTGRRRPHPDRSVAALRPLHRHRRRHLPHPAADRRARPAPRRRAGPGARHLGPAGRVRCRPAGDAQRHLQRRCGPQHPEPGLCLLPRAGGGRDRPGWPAGFRGVARPRPDRRHPLELRLGETPAVPRPRTARVLPDEHHARHRDLEGADFSPRRLEIAGQPGRARVRSRSSRRWSCASPRRQARPSSPRRSPRRSGG